MPVTIIVDPAANVVTYTATGELTFSEMREAYESVFSYPDFRPNMNAICDGRDARIVLSIGEIASPDFGLSTMFEMQTYALPFEVKVLRSITQAKAWLAGDSA